MEFRGTMLMVPVGSQVEVWISSSSSSFPSLAIRRRRVLPRNEYELGRGLQWRSEMDHILWPRLMMKKVCMYTTMHSILSCCICSLIHPQSPLPWGGQWHHLEFSTSRAPNLLRLQMHKGFSQVPLWSNRRGGRSYTIQFAIRHTFI